MLNELEGYSLVKLGDSIDDVIFTSNIVINPVSKAYRVVDERRATLWSQAFHHEFWHQLPYELSWQGVNRNEVVTAGVWSLRH